MHLPRADGPLRLPAPPPPAQRPTVPVLTAVVPVVGAGVLWVVTGSVYALWFAALGPLLALAGLFDGRRGARRARRRVLREIDADLARLRAAVDGRHRDERRERWARHPDVRRHLAQPDETWRAVPGRADALVVGSGAADSAVRLEGADDAPGARELRREAAVIDDVPVTVPWGAGIAVTGPVPLAAAVARGLVVQACLNLPPGALRMAGAAEDWAEVLPHRRAGTGSVIRLIGAGEPIPPQVDMPIAVVPEGMPPPPRCAAVLTLVGPARARLDHGATSTEVDVDPLSRGQAAEIGALLARRAEASLGMVDDDEAALTELLADAPPSTATLLPAVVGTAAGAPAVIDLVADGPHAVVIGVTGSGKSELLTTWVAALAATHTPQQVAFLLVDFKGGRTFAPLTALPHVTGVLTDLDETAALRAVGSLRAELRHRERVLAGLGARDVAEADGGLGRLVIVVDEYAALVAAHPSLHDLFGDIAARGRALGLHLILASQRASGVFRDAVLANAPLRIALRVTDAADSRAVLGVEDAAALSGRPEDRGYALVRRGGDAVHQGVRVARCPPDLLQTLASRPAVPARRPWLPPLPERIALDDVRVAGERVLGVADEPELQRRSVCRLAAGEPGLVVIGGPGSGKTTVLRALAAQAVSVLRIPADPEAGWDAVADAARADPGTLVIADDLDVLLSRLPPDHAAVVRERCERLAREGRDRGVQLVFSIQRAVGPAARLAEAVPRRFVLAQASRADHVAAGGEGADFVATLPPGRGWIDRTLVQSAWTEPEDAETPVAAPPWHPGRHPVALAVPAGARVGPLLAGWQERGLAISPVEAAEARLTAGTVLWGTPEAWLAQWRLLSAARAEAHLVVDAACGAEYRALTGERDLPPYADAAATPRRAWLRTPGGAVTRIALVG